MYLGVVGNGNEECHVMKTRGKHRKKTEQKKNKRQTSEAHAMTKSPTGWAMTQATVAQRVPRTRAARRDVEAVYDESRRWLIQLDFTSFVKIISSSSFVGQICRC